MGKLYLIRGLPGSGKTTLASKMAQEKDLRHFEADMWFTDSDGTYNFDAKKLYRAHEWCRDMVEAEVIAGRDVIVSNTFTTYKEMETYLLMCVAHQYQAIVIACTGDYGTVHNVPPTTIFRMKQRWLTNAALEEKLSNWGQTLITMEA